MTLYEINTNDKVIRSCSENENTIRGERGDTINEDIHMNILSQMPNTYMEHCDANYLLFNNPLLKKYIEYNPYVESSIDYNLQLNNGNTNNSHSNSHSDSIQKSIHSNYQNELYDKLRLSNIDTFDRNIDNTCTYCYY